MKNSLRSSIAFGTSGCLVIGKVMEGEVTLFFMCLLICSLLNGSLGRLSEETSGGGISIHSLGIDWKK